MPYKSIGEMYDGLRRVFREKEGGIEILDENMLRGQTIDRLVYNAVFNANEGVLTEARALIKNLAASLGIKPASIQGLYEAMGRNECGGFTVPAINIRGLTYDTARAIFRSAAKAGAGAFIFEIARSEIAYTGQRPSEYAACCLGAAIKEGHRGPVFLQGDHFQINAKKYLSDRDSEADELRKLIKEAFEADFFNIDIDASTIVDLKKPSVAEQQRPNFETTAGLTEFIRANEPAGCTVSVGGEIGEVGGKNSTVEELKAFMEGYFACLGKGVKGISKISVQTGTSHGGVVLPDGTMAKVKVDFETIESLSRAARRYGLAGVVQHGASTLPDEAFDIFPKRGAAEIHLATGFQNMIYDSPAFPEGFKKEIYRYLSESHADERKEGDTEEQFIYKTRKKGFGPFKEKMWNLHPERTIKIREEIEGRMDLFFRKLNAAGTAAYVKKYAAC